MRNGGDMILEKNLFEYRRFYHILFHTFHYLCSITNYPDSTRLRLFRSLPRSNSLSINNSTAI